MRKELSLLIDHSIMESKVHILAWSLSRNLPQERTVAVDLLDDGAPLIEPEHQGFVALFSPWMNGMHVELSRTEVDCHIRHSESKGLLQYCSPLLNRFDDFRRNGSLPVCRFHRPINEMQDGESTISLFYGEGIFQVHPLDAQVSVHSGSRPAASCSERVLQIVFRVIGITNVDFRCKRIHGEAYVEFIGIDASYFYGGHLRQRGLNVAGEEEWGEEENVSTECRLHQHLNFLHIHPAIPSTDADGADGEGRGEEEIKDTGKHDENYSTQEPQPKMCKE